MTANRRLNEILIRDDGFSKTEITISEGETVLFCPKKNNENFSFDEISLIQVVYDDKSDNFHTVIGGYHYETIDSKIPVRFKIIGEFLFKLKNHPKNPVPCKINVIEEIPHNVIIGEEGFIPKHIRIDEGTSIRWSWSKLSSPHTIFESSLCEDLFVLERKSQNLVIPSLTNDYTRKFQNQGVFYFQSETKAGDRNDLCVVEVQPSYKEHTVEILDNKFSPARVTIEEGDLVWFHWNKTKCLKKHCVYQIHLPSPEHPSDKAYLPVKNGFRWNSPSRNGMICHKFEKCGVYYYGDICGNECASYIGIVAVKPKCNGEFLVYSQDGQKFDKNVVTVESGDYIWFKWPRSISASIKLDDTSLISNKVRKKNRNENESPKYDPSALEKSGVFAYRIYSAGCYYFNVKSGDNTYSITIISSSAQKDHKVTITDFEAQPSILNIYPEDRVWFVWDETKRPQNVRQVNHANRFISGGFLSGSLMESPGTYVESFSKMGIFYFTSDNFKKILGAIAVLPEPTIHVVQINEKEISPDPIVVHKNDVVIWKFDSDQTNDKVLIKKEEDLVSYSKISREILPRRFLSHVFRNNGVYHFASPSFDTTIKPEFFEKVNALEKTVLSSVIVDSKEEYNTVHLNRDGFYPNIINIQVGKSVLFDWQETNESHNIIHMSMPDDKDILKSISGPNAFSSGSLVPNNSFLHAFEDVGEYCVISEGAPGRHCIIRVLSDAKKTDTPKLVNKESLIVYKYHKVLLECSSADADIHYTLDGSAPNKLTKKYNAEIGIILNEEGIQIIRAIAYSKTFLTSDIFTSQRFYVIKSPEPEIEPYKSIEPIDTSSDLNSQWWRCIPKISFQHVGVGSLEIYWDPVMDSILPFIKYYQIFLNQVSYRKYIPANVNKVIIKGLAGNRNYDIMVMIYPKDKSLLPQQSNKVAYTTAKFTNLGGPIISLKASPKPNEIILTWLSLDNYDDFIDHYDLLIDDEVKKKIKYSSGRHKLTIEGFLPDTKYSLILTAVPKDGSLPLVSNELEIMLPLNVNEIKLPDPSQRYLEDDFYDEYIEIVDLQSKSVVYKSNEPTEEPKYATYLSYDNYLLPNMDFESPKNNDTLSEELNPEEPKVLDNNYLTNKLGHIDPNFNNEIAPEAIDQSSIPEPKITVSHPESGKILIQWYLNQSITKYIELTHFVILLIGNEFSSKLKSDASYDCMIEKDGKTMPGVQHSWIIKNKNNYENKFVIDGILDTSLYQITVNAVYKQIGTNEIKEYVKSSKTVIYTPLGSPYPPNLRVNSVDEQSATIEWLSESYPRQEFITGYRLFINSEQGELFNKDINQFLLKDMQPGKQYSIQIVTLTDSVVPQSKPSNPITIMCPLRPSQPLISQLPSVRPNSATIGWRPVEPKSIQKHDQIVSYKVFVNKKFHGEIFSTNSSSYSYTICDLIEGKFYDVQVYAYCGKTLKNPTNEKNVCCIIGSEASNRLSVTPTAPPDAVQLRLASINTDGVELSWSFPQQYGDAVLSGFQLVKNGHCYGSIIPSDQSSIKITDLELGETVEFQMISLTNHPVGKYTPIEKHPDYGMDQPQRQELFERRKNASTVRSDYPACRISEILTVKYSNLVKPVVKIWTEKVTGFSAIVAFQTSKMNENFVEPDYYLVSYWPGTNPSDKNTKTVKTEKDFVQLNNLKPTQLYTVQVESRKETKRLEPSKSKSNNEYKFIVYSKSNLLQFQTASPPDPPTNLAVISTTCHAIKISWDPPIDHGSEIIAIRIDCHSIDSKKPLNIFKELTPDKKSCIIDNLSEKTRYKITVTAISEEYFINHKIKELKQLPKLVLESMPWLPRASIEAMTSGTDPASGVKCKLTLDSCLDVFWKSARVYGTNKFISQILCYQDIKEENMAVQIPLPYNVRNFKLENIKIGSKYKIWVEAVVMIKLNIESDSINESGENHYREIKNSRCTNVCSEALIFRVPAPCEPVIVNLTGYTTDSIEIFWAKPCMYSEHKDPDNSEENIFLFRHLIGYRIEVNGIRQRSLLPHENFCILTKCKPHTTYNIVVIAQTCLISSFERSNEITEDEIDVSDIDESFSDPLQVTTFADNGETYLVSLKGKFEKILETDEPSSIGRIRLDWDIPKILNIGQLNINWLSVEESLSRRKSFDPSLTYCFVPVTKSKCIYEISLDVVSDTSKILFTTDRLFLEIPGSPDAPFIWLKEKKENTVVIHWSEPRVYQNNQLDGYQLYLNDTKIGAKINKNVQIANIPLKMNRIYKINIQALSDDFENSEMSNSINISTSLSSSTQQVESVSMNQKEIFAGSNHQTELRRYYESENNSEYFEPKSCIPVKIKKIGQDYVDIDWSDYAKDSNSINEFKIQWHCLNSNQNNEHRCPSNVTSYRVKRLGSGMLYCIKVFAIKDINTLVKRSKNIILQMNAAPDKPTIKLRACNNRYITIDWKPPMTYGESHIVAYKLFINDRVEAVLSSEQTTFTWTRGSPCQDYVFQVQALSTDESLASPLSDPLRVTLPGIKIPKLQSIENENNILRITWDEPIISGGAKISYFRCIAENELSGRIQIQGPFDESIRECEFSNLDIGRHKIHLEITVHGSVQPLSSNPIYVDIGQKPEAPNLQIQVLGLAERKKLDKIASNLINKRDRLLRIVTFPKGEKANLPKLIANLRHLEDALNDCLKLLANYTGLIVANLSWSCYQPNQTVRLLGFRIYVNGKQYGSDLNASARSVRIKLSLEKPVHSIFITAFTDRKRLESQNSNVVELISENFFPFSFFCLNNIHFKNKSWPEKGCCAYQDSLSTERDMISSSKELVNLGKLKEKQETFKCEVVDLISLKKTYMESKSRSNKMTVVLFWTKWCLPSIKLLNFFVMYARQYSKMADYISFHCGNEDPKELYELIKRAGYLNENVTFLNDVQYNSSSEGIRKSSVDQFDLKGVPTVMILNKNGQMIWKGRHCVCHYRNFENFMNHTFSELNETSCTNESCELCSNDSTIDPELFELRSEQKSLTHYLESYIKPTSDAWQGLETHKRSVPKLPRITTRQLISVPTSANLRSSMQKQDSAIVSKKHLFSTYSINEKSRTSSNNGYCYRSGRILI